MIFRSEASQDLLVSAADGFSQLYVPGRRRPGQEPVEDQPPGPSIAGNGEAQLLICALTGAGGIQYSVTITLVPGIEAGSQGYGLTHAFMTGAGNDTNMGDTCGAPLPGGEKNDAMSYDSTPQGGHKANPLARHVGSRGGGNEDQGIRQGFYVGQGSMICCRDDQSHWV